MPTLLGSTNHSVGVVVSLRPWEQPVGSRTQHAEPSNGVEGVGNGVEGVGLNLTSVSTTSAEACHGAPMLMRSELLSVETVSTADLA